jgi:hypothetical protein
MQSGVDRHVRLIQSIAVLLAQDGVSESSLE